MMSGTADEARIVGTGTDARVVVTKSSDSRAALLLESHRLIDLKARGRPRGRDASGAKVDTERVTFGLGPFLAIQSSQSEVIEGIGFGVMGGLRVGEASSFNLGIGGMLDPSAKVLAEGFRNGQPPPAGATEVLFSEEAKWGFVVLVSFAF
jgi:hypothetical protein